MRIRKHANISQLLDATSSLNPVQTRHINCQLNQSPWDVITFSPPSSPPPPPPPSQLDIGYYIHDPNASSLLDTIPVSQRKFSGRHMKEEYSGGGTITGKAEQPVILCGKTDGKSWQCRKESAKGNYSTNHSINKKSEKLVGQAHKKPEKSVGRPVDTQHSTRPRKAPSSSNSHEFYYYAGFGPRWGKKRGGVSTNGIGSSMPKNGDDEDELDSSMSYQFDEEITDYEDHEENHVVKRKKKARKPIKERSLKSLM